ncbi:MAG: DUF6062 family protein [Armatimonadota bacterium]
MHLLEMALEEALQQDTCALCWLAQQRLIRRVDTLLSEHVLDPEWRQSLREGNGFCPPHAQLLLKRGQVLSLSLIAEDVLSVAPLLAAQCKLKVWRCQLCEAHAHEVTQSAERLAQMLIAEEWRARYAQSNGLCLPHLQKVLSYARAEVRRWLVENESQRWQRLRWQLQEVVRKHDYRFQQEPWGEEIGSWRRAFHKLYGVSPEEVHDER